MPSPELVSKYNGLANLLRTSNVFTIEPFAVGDYYFSTRGARAASWARHENGDVARARE